MTEKIVEAMGEILKNPDLLEKFAKSDEIDEMYRLCLSVRTGYTKDEFCDFLTVILCLLDENMFRQVVFNKSQNSFNILDDDEIDQVAGGTGKIGKFMATSLAAVSMLTPMFSANKTSAAGSNNSKSSTSKHVRNSKKNAKEMQEVKESWIKRGFKAIWNNKWKIALGAGTIAGICLGGKKLVDWWKTDSAVREANKKVLDDLKKDVEEKRKKFTENKDEQSQKAYNEAKKKLDDQGSSISNLLKYTKGIGGVVGIGGLAWSGVTSIFNSVTSKVHSGGKFFKDVGDGVSNMQSLWRNFTRFLTDKATEINKEAYDKNEKMDQLYEELDERVRGQEKAKKAVKGFFQRVIADRLRSANTGVKNKAKVIVFNGPSGCGKSFTADILARSLTTAPIYSMSASEVDIHGGSLVDQLFNKYSYNPWDWSSNSGQGFSKYINDHPNDGVVIINEYDKMYNQKSGAPHELDEVMRTFIDEGKAVISGKEFDCSGITFILTTNESDASLNGEVEVGPTGKLYDPSKKDDTTGSLTTVLHDKSFLNRLTIVGFDNLSVEEYAQIAKDNFASTIEFLATEEGGGIQVHIDDESYRKMGEKLLQINQGARPISKFIGDMFVSVIEKTNALREADEECEDIALKVDFNYDDDSFWFEVEQTDYVEDEQEQEQNQEENNNQNEQNQKNSENNTEDNNTVENNIEQNPSEETLETLNENNSNSNNIAK